MISPIKWHTRHNGWLELIVNEFSLHRALISRGTQAGCTVLRDDSQIYEAYYQAAFFLPFCIMSPFTRMSQFRHWPERSISFPALRRKTEHRSGPKVSLRRLFGLLEWSLTKSNVEGPEIKRSAWYLSAQPNQEFRDHISVFKRRIHVCFLFFFCQTILLQSSI